MISMHGLLKNQAARYPEEKGENGNNKNAIIDDEVGSDYEPKEKMRTKIARFFEWSNWPVVLFYAVCIIGCTFQMVQVSIEYIKFETVTDLRIQRPREIFPPTMSICFPLMQMIDFRKAFKLHPELKNAADEIAARNNVTIDYEKYRMVVFKSKDVPFDYEMSKKLYREYKMNELIEMAKTIDDIFMRCVLVKPENYDVIETKNITECKTIWEIDHFVKDENICFSFGFKRLNDRDTIYDLEQLSSTFTWRDLLMQIRLNVHEIGENLERMFIYFHPWNRLPAGRIDPSMTFKKPAKNVTYSMTYARIYNKLLEPPYESMCRRFEKSRGASIDDCFRRKSARKFQGRVPFTTLFEKDANFSVIGVYELDGNDSLSMQLEQMFAYCSKLVTKRDCELEIFRPELQATTMGGNNLKIEVAIPSALDIITELNPKQTFLEYVIFNGSTFGFWFGFCAIQIVTFYQVAKEKSARKIQKRKNKKRNEQRD